MQSGHCHRVVPSEIWTTSQPGNTILIVVPQIPHCRISTLSIRTHVRTGRLSEVMTDRALTEEDAPTTQLLTAKQLAKRWQVSIDQVYALTRAREIPALRLGRLYRYKLEVIEQFERGEDGTAHAA
jgi:excisionase family DNA binding protein